MELQPYFKDQAISGSGITVEVTHDDRERAKKLVALTANIREVIDLPSFNTAKKAAGQLRSMIDEITDAEKAAKRPWRAVQEKIGGLATEISEPVQNEYTRIQALLNRYVGKLEQERAEAERKEREKQEAKEAEAQRKIKEALQAKREAELRAQQAIDEVERLKAQQEAKERSVALQQAELARDLDLEVIGIKEPPKGLVPGGRVTHPRSYKITDIWALIRAKRLDLLRYEINISACHEEVRRQLEANPDVEPEIPGVEITTQINVSVKPQAPYRLN